MAYSLSLAEQETVVRFDRSTDKATICTCDPYMMRKLAEFREQNSAEWILTREDEYSVTYEFTKDLLKLRAKKRTLSDKQREQCFENMKRIKSKKEVET